MVAVFGAGVQARTQLEAVCSVRSIRRAYVYDLNPSAADRLADEMTKRLGAPVERATDPRQALEHADVVCTATTSRIPVFDDADLQPGTHINAIGSYRPEVSEIPPATVCRARIVVDHRVSALEEAGDLLGPVRQGLLQETHFRPSWARSCWASPGRSHRDEITLFKSVGVAIQDLCAAAWALENACRLQLGVPMQRNGETSFTRVLEVNNS